MSQSDRPAREHLKPAISFPSTVVTPKPGKNILDTPRLAWDHSSRRVWRLLDIMRHFKAYEIGYCLRDLERLASQLDESVIFSVDDCDELATRTLSVLNLAVKLCDEARLKQSCITLPMIVDSINGKDVLRNRGTRDPSAIRTDIKHASEAILQDLAQLQFLSIDPAKASYLDNRDFLGARVPEAFPSAIPDIIGAGNALATECNTAAVFHLMRVVEWGLRSLASHLGVRRVKASKKPGNRKYHPLSFLEWEKILAHRAF